MRRGRAAVRSAMRGALAVPMAMSRAAAVIAAVALMPAAAAAAEALSQSADPVAPLGAEARPAAPSAAATAQKDVLAPPEKTPASLVTSPGGAPPRLLSATAEPWTFSAGGDVRGRFEYRGNYDLNSAAPALGSVDYLRTRINGSARYRSAELFVEALDAQEFVTPITPTDGRTGFASLDLHQAYLDWNHVADGPLSVKVGRQEMNIGSTYLVCSSGWSNLPRAWDALRLRADDEGWSVEAVAGRPVVYDATGFDTWKSRENFFGAFSKLALARKTSLELYVWGLHDQALADPKKAIQGEDKKVGTATRITPGFRLLGALAPKDALEYEAEFALQRGHKANDLVQAFAAHAALTYKLLALPASPAVKLESNYASGDKRSGDGLAQTFNPLFGTTHDPFGMADFVRWQNLRELALVVSGKPHERVGATLEYHALWLATAHDSWVNASGQVVRAAKPDSPSSFLGHELDAKASVRVIEQIRLESGVAWFAPGGLVKNTGTADAAALFYLQLLARI